MPLPKPSCDTAQETEAAFYQACAQGDLDTIMELWADDDDIVCIHPGSARACGHADIRQSFKELFSNRGAVVSMHAVALQIVHTNATSVHALVEFPGSATTADHTSHILATNIYVRTASGWRLTLHHASIAPGKAPMPTGNTNLLH